MHSKRGQTVALKHQLSRNPERIGAGVVPMVNSQRFLPFMGTRRILKPGSPGIMERCNGLRRSRRDSMKVEAQYEVLGRR
jgi:hypothetical protein